MTVIFLLLHRPAISSVLRMPWTMRERCPVVCYYQHGCDTGSQGFQCSVGEIHASARTDLVQDSFYVRNAAVDRLRDAACDPGAGNGALKTATMQGHLTDGLCQSNRSAMWMEAYGGWGRNSGDGNASGMNHSVGGFVLGADTMVAGNWRVGGMVGYGHSTFNSRAVDSYGHSNNVSIGGYAGTHWGRLAFRMGAAYTWNMLSTGRTIALSSMNNGKANSQYDAVLRRHLAIWGIACIWGRHRSNHLPMWRMLIWIRTGLTNMALRPH